MSNNIIDYILIVQSDGVVRAVTNGNDSGPGQLDSLQIELAEGYALAAESNGLTDRAKIERLGTYLYKTLFGGPISGHFQELAWRKVVSDPSQNSRVRFRLVFQQGVDPKIVGLPWEFLFYPEGATFIGTHPKISFFCEYEDWLMDPFESYSPDELPLRILFVHTHPNDLQGVGVNPTIRSLEEFDPTQARFEELINPSPVVLQEKLQQYRPHAFHFLGHGQFKEDDGSFTLLDHNGQAFWYDSKSFGDLFRGWQPRLVIIQACEGGKISRNKPFSGGAAWLVRQHIPAVVTMRYQILQKRAWAFTGKFYESLSIGLSIDEAVQAGRSVLALAEDSGPNHSNRDFASPVLWMRLREGYLIAGNEQSQSLESVTASPLTDYGIPSAIGFYLDSIISLSEELESLYISLSGKTKRPIGPHQTTWSREFIPPAFRVIDQYTDPDSETTELLDGIEEALNIHARFVLLGDPGSGKTLTLRKLLLDSAKKAKKDPKARIPIYIKLATWPEHIFDVPTLLAHEGQLQGLPTIHFNRLLILMDGLNEMPAASYSQRIKMIEDWLRVNPSLSVIVSCRESHYKQRERLSLPIVQVYPLDEKRIRLLLSAYLPGRWETLLRQLGPEDVSRRSPRDLIHLSSNPFLLAMIVYVYEKVGELPSSRGFLFRMFVKTLYGREASYGTAGNLSYDDLILGLSRIAFAMHKKHSATAVGTAWASKQIPSHIQAEHLWELGSQCSLLDLSNGDTVLQFKHQLLLEYFAAEGVLSDLSNLKALLNKPTFRSDERVVSQWDEVIYTLVGITDSNFVLRELAEIDPFLAVDCLEHVPANIAITSEVMSLIIMKLIRYFELSSAARAAAISSISELGQMAIPYLISTFENGAPITKRASLEVLGQLDDPLAIEGVIIALNDGYRWVRREALAIFDSLTPPLLYTAVDMLVQALSKNKWEASMEAISGLVSLITQGNMQILERLISVLANESEGISAAKSVIKGGNEWALKSVFQTLILAFPSLDEEEFAKAANAVDKLLLVLTEKTSSYPLNATLHFGEQDYNWIMELYFLALSFEDKKVRTVAIDSIWKLSNTLSISSLNEDISKEDDTFYQQFLVRSNRYFTYQDRVSQTLRGQGRAARVRRTIASSANDGVSDSQYKDSSLEELLYRLSYAGETQAKRFSDLILSMGPAIVEPLIEVLASGHERIRKRVTNILAKLGDRQAVQPLIRALNDSSIVVKCRAIKALGDLGDNAAVPALLDLLNDEKSQVRWYVIRALRKLGGDEVKDRIIPLLDDEGSQIRKEASLMLRQLDYSQPARFLLDLEDIDVTLAQLFKRLSTVGTKQSSRVIDEICKLGSSAVEPLIYVLGSGNEKIRRRAPRALAKLKDKRAVQPLIERLKDPAWLVREHAAKALGELGDPVAVPSLLPLLHDERPVVRRHAVRALERLGSPDLADRLIPMLGDNSPDVRTQAIHSLRQIKPPQLFEILVKAVTDPNIQVRIAAVMGLGELQEVRIVSHVIQALFDTDTDIRTQAAISLRKPYATDAVEPLIQALSDDSPTVRSNVVITLGVIKDPRSIKPLIETLNDAESQVYMAAINALKQMDNAETEVLLMDALLHDSLSVRCHVASILGSSGTSRAVEALIQTLNDDCNEVRINSINALAELSPEQALEFLISMLSDKDVGVRINSIRTLSQLADPNTVESLLPILTDEDIGVRNSAAMALGRFGDSRAVKPLIHALADPESAVRSSAAMALGRIGDLLAIDPLIKALFDEDSDVRCNAALALSDLGDSRAIEPLIEALSDQNSDVRSYTATALGELGNALAAAPLIQALADESIQVRISAISALGKLSVFQAIEPLAEVLSSKDKNLRRYAATALGEIGSPEAAEPLIKAVSLEDDDQVRIDMVVALGEFQDQRVTDALTLLLADKNPRVQQTANEVLSRLLIEKQVDAYDGFNLDV